MEKPNQTGRFFGDRKVRLWIMSGLLWSRPVHDIFLAKKRSEKK